MIIEGNITGPALHGIKRLEKMKDTMPIRLGIYTESDIIKQIIDTNGIKLEHQSEAYTYAKLGEETILVGYDSRGLMYGCFELCERLEHSENKIITEDFNDAPYTRVRGIYDFLHNKDIEKEWFYSKEYWTEYFDMLANNRYNSYNLVFSHQTHYLVPMFAYFLKVEEHPEVFPDDITPQEHQKNYEMLHFISQEADRRGIDFILGIWQIRAWKGGENDWRPPQKNNVKGLTDDNLVSYTYLALKKLFEEFPNVKGIQIRANEESGIPNEKQTDFYTKTFFRAINESKRPIIFDFRCWRAEDQTVENALEMCPDIRLSAKYWAEFMGQPYQPAKIDPGYSYANYLKQPLKCDFVYQVWTLGNPRLLLWGDPGYVRRFVDSLKLGGGCGFEINPHLAQKGYGDEPGNWRIFKHKEDEYYDFEYKRYWMFYELFGRLSYNPNISDDKWTGEIQKRLKMDEALSGNMLDAYTYSSRVINFLIQYTLNDPNMYVWPEIDTGGILDLYLQTPTSDKCVIYPITEYVRDYLKGEVGGRFTPENASKYLKGLSDKIFRNVKVLESEFEKSADKELKASIIDFKVLGFLALYHSKKIIAALKLEFFYQSRDLNALYQCYQLIRECTVCWEQLITITEDFYYDKMVTGPSDAGSWETKLKFVYEDELRITELLEIFDKYGNFHKGFDFGIETKIEIRDFHDFPILKEYSTEKGFICVDSDGVFNEDRNFGFEDSSFIKYVKAPYVRLSDKHLDYKRRDANFNFDVSFKGYKNMLHEDYLYSEKPARFIAGLENGEYVVTAVMCDQSTKAAIHGPMSIAINGVQFSDIVTGPLEYVERKTTVNVTDGRLVVDFDCAEGADWFISALIVTKKEPAVKMVPVYRYEQGKETIISATVTCPSEIESVTLLLKASDGKTLGIPMVPGFNDVYSVDVTKFISEEAKNYVYSVSAVSREGLTAQSEEVSLSEALPFYAIDVKHTAVNECRQGEDIELTFEVGTGVKISSAKLFYSYVNHYEKLQCVDMVLKDGIYKARIPKEYITPDWLIMYYAEFVGDDIHGIVYPDFRKETPYKVITVI